MKSIADDIGKIISASIIKWMQKDKKRMKEQYHQILQVTTISVNINAITAPRQRGKTPHNECPGHDTKQSDGEVPVMLELWGMRGPAW